MTTTERHPFKTLKQYITGRYRYRYSCYGHKRIPHEKIGSYQYKYLHETEQGTQHKPFKGEYVHNSPGTRNKLNHRLYNVYQNFIK